MIDDEVIEQEDEEDDYCQACAGTGEGQYDGARCWSCKGKGIIKHIKDDEK